MNKVSFKSLNGFSNNYQLQKGPNLRLGGLFFTRGGGKIHFLVVVNLFNYVNYKEEASLLGQLELTCV